MQVQIIPIVLFFMTFTGSSFANWVTDPVDILPQNQTRLLQDRHPTVNNPMELTRLLAAINRMAPQESLEAEYNDGSWVIKGKKSRLIQDFRLEISTRIFVDDIESRLHVYLGQVDSPEMMQRIFRDLRNYLTRRGFYENSVKVTSEINARGWSDIMVSIEEGYPCRLRQIDFGFELPKEIHFAASVGDICDRKVIEEMVADLTEDLIEAGFNQSEIYDFTLDYDINSNSARLFLPGKVGKKIKYEIVSSSTKFSAFTIFSEDELNSIDPTIVDPESMQSEIYRKYRAAGYTDVVVASPKKIATREEELTYQFQVTPGTRYEIREVQISGLSVISEDEALETMGFKGFWQSSPPLRESMIRDGMDLLNSRYKELGYWDFKIRYPRITKTSETGETKLHFIAREGLPYTFDRIHIEGIAGVPVSRINELWELEQGKPLRWDDILTFEKKLRGIYHEYGFLYLKLSIDLAHSRGFRSVPTKVNVKIEEGARVKFGTISIRGLAKTAPKVVRRELRFQEGEWYDPKLIEQTRRALINLGLFSTVSIVPTDESAFTEKESILDHTILLREGRPGTVAFGPGWSIQDGMRFSVESSYNNISGLGRQVFARGYLSEERSQDAIGHKTLIGRTLSFGYMEPYIFDTPLNGHLSLSHRAKSGEKRWDLTRSAEIGTTHKLRAFIPGADIGLFYCIQINEEIATATRRSNLVTTSDVKIAELGLRYSYDRRNDITWPTRGYIIRSEYSKAIPLLGGDISYDKIEFNSGYYYELAPRWVAAFGFEWDQYFDVKRTGINPHVLPASERLQSGGANSNRGYNLRDLGPVVDFYNEDEATREVVTSGGSRKGTYKFELRYQVIPGTIAVTQFIDASNVAFSESEESVIRARFAASPVTDPSGVASKLKDNIPYRFEDQFKTPSEIWDKNYSSYGLALNYLTPLGSLNLSYGLPWKQCIGGKSCVKRGNTVKSGLLGGVFHFNVGTVF